MMSLTGWSGPAKVAELVVALYLVHRRADALGDAGEQPVPPEVRHRLVRRALVDLLRADVRSRVELRVVERHLQFERIEVDASPGLLDPRVEAFRVASVVEPRTVVEAHGVDDKRA